jgi:hypothetical protein
MRKFEKMQADMRQKVWEMAVPLADAWLNFATPEMRAKFDGIEGPIETFTHTAQSSPDSGFWNAVSAGFAAKSGRDALIREMREHLLEELFNSEIIAIGFRLYPSKSPRPVAIDANFFEGSKINWSDSTAQWLGKVYINVRAISPHDPDLFQYEQASKGSVDAIDRAITELRLSNPGFCDLPRKSSCQLVRERIGISAIDGDGLSDQNIAKRVLRQCPKRAIRIK